MKDLFTPLIQGLCGLYKLDVRHVLAGKTLEIEGIRFFLRHHQEEFSTLLLMYCDFGPVPEEHETAIYKLLLQSNLASFTGQGETFSLSPDNRVVFVHSFSLEMLTPAILSAHMALTSVRAQNWPQECLRRIAASATAPGASIHA